MVEQTSKTYPRYFFFQNLLSFGVHNAIHVPENTDKVKNFVIRRKIDHCRKKAQLKSIRENFEVPRSFSKEEVNFHIIKIRDMPGFSYLHCHFFFPATTPDTRLGMQRRARPQYIV